jgi:hypothetical protein
MSLKQMVETQVLQICMEPLNLFQKGYQPKTNMVKDGNDYLFADIPTIF